MRPCRIVVVDDQPMFLAIVGDLLADMPGLEVVGRASSGQDALEMAGRWTPDLVVTDLQMPGMNGLELTRQLEAAGGSLPVIILTIDDQPQYRAAAEAAGAAGFLCKSNLVDQLPELVRRLLPQCGGSPDETPLGTAACP